eukprot:7431968-Pyramimonas_sp.AAC.1
MGVLGGPPSVVGAAALLRLASRRRSSDGRRRRGRSRRGCPGRSLARGPAREGRGAGLRRARRGPEVR